MERGGLRQLPDLLQATIIIDFVNKNQTSVTWKGRVKYMLKFATYLSRFSKIRDGDISPFSIFLERIGPAIFYV